MSEFSARLEGTAEKDTERTRTGIWLLIFATLLSWIPYLNILGFILGAAGVILIILSRGTFGGNHYNYPVAAAVIFVVGTVIAFILVLSFATDITSMAASGSLTVSSALSALSSLYAGVIIAGLITGLSYVLILYALEDRFGRILAWCGFAAQVVVISVATLVTYAIVKSGMVAALSSNPPNSAALASVIAELNGIGYLKLLDAIPVILFAIAYWTVIRRIDRNEIPEIAVGVAP